MTRDEIRSEVARLYREGLSTRDVAARFGRSAPWASAQLKAAGVQPRPRSVPGRIPAHLVEVKPAAVEAMRAGAGRVETAARFGISARTATMWAQEAGLPRLPSRPPSKRTADVVRLYQEGLSLKQVASLVGLDLSSVWRVLRRAGEPIRRRGCPRKVEADRAAAEVRATGCRVEDAAALYKVSIDSVYRRLRQPAPEVSR